MKSSLVIEGRVGVVDAARLVLVLEAVGIPATSKSDLVNKAFSLAVKALGASDLDVGSIEEAVDVLSSRNLLYTAGGRRMRSVVNALQVEHITMQDVDAMKLERVKDMSDVRPAPATKADMKMKDLVAKAIEQVRRDNERKRVGSEEGEGDAIPSEEGGPKV